METVASAQRRILGGLRRLGTESAPLAKALGRVLAEPLTSRATLPPFDNSAMDGYAVRAAELRGASEATPVTLPGVGESRAGAPPGMRLQPGTAMRIMTGAPVPDGADAVVRREDTEGDEGDSRVRLLVEVAVGTSIRRSGEDMRPGDLVLEAGRRLRGPDLAAAAALGHAELTVARRPRVAVISTGDELVEVGAPIGPGQIVDSNAVAIAAAVVEAGGVPVRLGIGGDSREALRALLTRAADSDLVVSSAGVSVGDHDHVRPVVEELGRLDLWRVAMRPGKPLAVGQIGTTPFLGLPGNPVSSQVTFEVFARPAILAMQGAAQPHRRRVVARTLERFTAPAGLETFARGILVADDDGAVAGVRLTGPQGSGIIRSMVDADCLVVIPAATECIESGELVEIIPLV